jgi:hypothetical protein
MLDNTRCGLTMDLITVGKSVLQKWRSIVRLRSGVGRRNPLLCQSDPLFRSGQQTRQINICYKVVLLGAAVPAMSNLTT